MALLLCSKETTCSDYHLLTLAKHRQQTERPSTNAVIYLKPKNTFFYVAIDCKTFLYKAAYTPLFMKYYQ